MTIIDQIIEAQKFIIANPVRACVNSESSFVKERLQKQGYDEAATLYWKFVCRCGNRITDETVIAQEQQLKSNFNMPVWGTSGT